MNQQLNELLQDCTVKLIIPGKRGWGSGFFVAPGLILTCAHVIEYPPGVYVKEGIKVSDRDRKDLPDAALDRLGEEYDLALLRLNLPSTIHPPCVYLDPEFKPFDSFYTFGYPGNFPNGASVTSESEGISFDEEGKEFILFKSGQIYPGISGSPLLNYRTGKVCGMVCFTRNRLTDLGGGAIPTRVILEQFEELSRLQWEFHQQDDRWSNSLQILQGGVWPEAVESIEFSTEELEPANNLTLLSFVFLLPVDLIKSALTKQQLSPRELEFVLKGKNVTNARQNLDSFNRNSQSQLSSIEREIQSLKQRQQKLIDLIDSIESMQPPEEPIGFYDDPDYQWRMMLYRQEIQSYNQKKDNIPVYERELAQIPQQIARLYSKLHARAYEINRKRELLEAKIDPARDRDIIDLLNQIKTEALRKLNHVTTELNGFVGLLSATLLSNYLQSYIFDPSSKILVQELAKVSSDRLDEFLQGNIKNLVRQLLLSAAVLNAGNESAQQLLSEIQDCLEQLPLHKIRDAHEQSLWVSKEIKMFEDYSQVLDPQILEQISDSLKIESSKIENSILQVQDFLDSTRELRCSVETTVSKVRNTVSDFCNRYKALVMKLNVFQLVWELIEYTANNSGSGTSVRIICLNLQELTQRKFKHSAKELIQIASKTQFGVPTANERIDNHESVQFLASQNTVEQHLKNLGKASEEYKKAIDDIGKVPKRQAEKYKSLLSILHLIAVIPVLNIVCLMIVRRQIRRLKKALFSQVCEYQQLAQYISNLCLLFLIFQSCLILTLAFVLVYFQLSSNVAELSKIVGVVSYLTSWGISIVNLITVRSYTSK